MKVSVNDVELYTVSDIQKKVMCHVINADIIDDNLKRRLQWLLMHKYERCFARLKQEWDPKLVANGVQSIPTDPDEYALLVLSQPNYKDRKARDEDSERP